MRLINPLGSRCTHRLLNLRQTSRLCTHNERPETMDQKYERILIFRCSPEETGVPRENLPRRVWNRQTKLTYNHWLATLVKGKCLSTKPTLPATGVMCHPDTEQNRPYKTRPWPCRGLNWRPTAPQARTLPVCHTTPHYYIHDTGQIHWYNRIPTHHCKQRLSYKMETESTSNESPSAMRNYLLDPLCLN